MEMLRAIIVEDDMVSAQHLKDLLQKTNKFKIEAIIRSPLKALTEIEEKLPDIVFLDIEMPGMTGLEIAEYITGLEKAPEIIFVTAYDEYALQAFKVNALDYITKPIDEQELKRVIDKIQKRGFIQDYKINGIKVNALGGFRVFVTPSFELIKWSTAKCEELFAYMLFQEKKIVSKLEIIDILWPEKDEKKSETNLRTTVCRLNQTFKKYGIQAKIKSERNLYKLEIDYVEVDAFFLENLGQSLENKKIDDFMIKRLYPGRLFAGCNYEWSEIAETYYEKLFIQWVKAEVLNSKISQQEPFCIYKILQNLLNIAPFDEELHEQLMCILFKMEGKKSVHTYYERLKKMMFNEMGVEPRKELEDLYKSLMK
jgi:two-component SAPR family response regulator